MLKFYQPKVSYEFVYNFLMGRDVPFNFCYFNFKAILTEELFLGIKKFDRKTIFEHEFLRTNYTTLYQITDFKYIKNNTMRGEKINAVLVNKIIQNRITSHKFILNLTSTLEPQNKSRDCHKSKFNSVIISKINLKLMNPKICLDVKLLDKSKVSTLKPICIQFSERKKISPRFIIFKNENKNKNNFTISYCEKDSNSNKLNYIYGIFSNDLNSFTYSFYNQKNSRPCIFSHKNKDFSNKICSLETNTNLNYYKKDNLYTIMYSSNSLSRSNRDVLTTIVYKKSIFEIKIFSQRNKKMCNTIHYLLIDYLSEKDYLNFRYKNLGQVQNYQSPLFYSNQVESRGKNRIGIYFKVDLNYKLMGFKIKRKLKKKRIIKVNKHEINLLKSLSCNIKHCTIMLLLYFLGYKLKRKKFEHNG